MRKGLLIVLILMCVATLMAAMAYSSATITNASTLTVTSSDKALLALEPKKAGDVGNKDGTASIDPATGKLSFNFSKGKTGDTGLQRSSSYQWDSLFTAKNNSNENITLKMRQDTLVTGVTVSVRASGGSNAWIPLTAATKDVADNIAGGGQSGIDVKIDVADTAELKQGNPFNIIVEAQAK